MKSVVKIWGILVPVINILLFAKCFLPSVLSIEHIHALWYTDCVGLQVVSFDGSTTVSEFLGSLEKAVGVRDSRNSGFSLCSDNPVDSSLENWLPSEAKVC